MSEEISGEEGVSGKIEVEVEAEEQEEEQDEEGEDEDEDEERDAGWLASTGGDGRVNVWQIWVGVPSPSLNNNKTLHLSSSKQDTVTYSQ